MMYGIHLRDELREKRGDNQLSEVLTSIDVLCESSDMKLSTYAKQHGISYKTAWRWYKAGTLDAYKTATGTVIVRDPRQIQQSTGRIALYARVSSAGQKEDLIRQLERLKDYAAVRGYQVAKEVTEIASGLNKRCWGTQASARLWWRTATASPVLEVTILRRCWKRRGVTWRWYSLVTPAMN